MYDTSNGATRAAPGKPNIERTIFVSAEHPNYNPDYAKYIEHSVLKPTTTIADVKRFCDEAMEYHFAAVAVTPYNVPIAYEFLKGSDVIVDGAIGFPLGSSTTLMKVSESVECIKNGAAEVDMVINIAALKDKRYDYVEREIKEFVKESSPWAGTKVILETYLLTEEEKIIVCKMAMEAGADYVKTCTGFNGGCATVEDIVLMKSVVGDVCKVKASTGVNDRAIADALIKAGAVRLGTSKGIKIVNGD